jgi:hypothetical protein
LQPWTFLAYYSLFTIVGINHAGVNYPETENSEYVLWY